MNNNHHKIQTTVFIFYRLCEDWSLFQLRMTMMLPCCYKCSWWLFVDGGGFRVCLTMTAHHPGERDRERDARSSCPI